MRISDWTDVCSSDLTNAVGNAVARIKRHTRLPVAVGFGIRDGARAAEIASVADDAVVGSAMVERVAEAQAKGIDPAGHVLALVRDLADRSEEHTSALQSLIRISYAVFCLEQQNQTTPT